MRRARERGRLAIVLHRRMSQVERLGRPAFRPALG
jgi:hypothetical protein